MKTTGALIGAAVISAFSLGLGMAQSARPTTMDGFVREAKTASLLGIACGLVVGMIVWLWQGTGMAAVVIGASILLSLCSACLLGLTVPSLLHALKLDPKIAAGPVTLALADICSILFYFTLADVLL